MLFKDTKGVIHEFSPLQVLEGLAQGMEEMNPAQLITIESLKAAVTQKRWEVETGGITMPTGVRVATGTEDQNRITSVIANAESAGLKDVDFKSESGWVTLTLPELKDIAKAIALHVQACFSAERRHHEAVDALDPEEQDALDAYDINSGWNL